VNDELRSLQDPHQAVLTLLPVRDFSFERFTSIGLALRFPRNDLPHRTVFGLRDPSAPDAVVIEAI
jgi:hypothetical protein